MVLPPMMDPMPLPESDATTTTLSFTSHPSVNHPSGILLSSNVSSHASASGTMAVTLMVCGSSRVSSGVKVMLVSLRPVLAASKSKFRSTAKVSPAAISIFLLLMLNMLSSSSAMVPFSVPVPVFMTITFFTLSFASTPKSIVRTWMLSAVTSRSGASMSICPPAMESTMMPFVALSRKRYSPASLVSKLIS